MSESDEFSFEAGVICKNCHRMFSFAQASQTLHGVKFPMGDTSVIEAHCPRCRIGRTYYPKDIWKDKKTEDQSELVTQLRHEIAQLKVDKGVMQKTIEDLMKTNYELVRDKSQASNITSEKTNTDNPLAT